VPRGPGLYLNPFSFLAVLVTYLAWVRLCAWVDADARHLHLNRQGWNLLVFGGGVAGLLLFWAIPWFPIAFAVLLAAVLAPLAAYIVHRNGHVPELERICTERHLRSLLNRHLKTNLPLPAPQLDHEVTLLLRADEEQKKEDPPRLKQARALPGFEAALQLLCTAQDRQASLVHIEPMREFSRIRLRIDGVLHDHDQFPRAQGELLLPVFKRLGELRLDERRKPQEGEFSVEIDGKHVDVRIRSQGNLAGERLMLRLREQGRSALTLDALGLREQASRLLRHQQGILVICGLPDGGRTTVGYACLMEIERHHRRVMSLEAHIEQRVDHVEQMELDRSARESAQAGLKRLFERDTPSAVLVDCPLDTEAVEFIYEKATDHFMIMVLEGEDAIAGMSRLLDLGLTQARLAKKLMGVVSVRLLRMLCPDCRILYQPNLEVLQRINLTAERIEHLARPPEGPELLRNDAGEVLPCLACQGLGFRGRQAIFEVLTMNERIREMLREGLPLAAIRQAAIQGGMKPLETSALDLAVHQVTSVGEVLGMLKSQVEPMPLAMPAESSRMPQPT